MSHPEPTADSVAPPGDEPTAIFRREGEVWTPTAFAQGPWNPEHLHGGAICGVFGHAVERCESPVPMRVARLTVEMTRAVPMEPFRVRAEVSRAGKRVQQVDARIEAGGKVLARATALRMRVAASDPEVQTSLEDPVPERVPGPEREEKIARLFFPGFIRALDFLRSKLPEPGGSGVSWARMRTPLVEGEETSPFVRLASLCDFASGTGNAIDYTRYTSINPDLSMHVLREPRGEWVGLRAWTQLQGDGIGQSHATLYDDEGAVARVLVSLLVEPRPR